MPHDLFDVNLLEETKKSIENFGQEIDNIVFIGSQESGHECSWELFKILADQEYDNGFGGQKVATDLIIIFKDGTKMFREEYDGSEWWEYLKPFEKPKEFHPIRSLFPKKCYQTLSETNNGQ